MSRLQAALDRPCSSSPSTPDFTCVAVYMVVPPIKSSSYQCRAEVGGLVAETSAYHWSHTTASAFLLSCLAPLLSCRYLDSFAPKMASPVSIGDAILLAQIAIKIGKAFTVGAKAAPVEFYQIQTLLVSISESLSAINGIITRDGQRRANDESSLTSEDRNGSAEHTSLGVVHVPERLIEALNATRAVLKTVEDFVAKYSVLNKHRDQVTVSANDRRFSIKRTWRAVLWSKDANEVARLRGVLVDHANSLSLLIATTKW
jgi:hypothetical protein